MFDHVIGHASEAHRGKLGENGDLTWATSYVLAYYYFAGTLQDFLAILDGDQGSRMVKGAGSVTAPIRKLIPYIKTSISFVPVACFA